MSSDIQKLPVVILAGKPENRDAFLEYADIDNKCLIEYQGKPLIQISFEAVLPIASKIFIMGMEKSEFSVPEVEVPVEFVEMNGEQYDKIFRGLELSSELTEDHVLFLSGDIPLIEADIVRRFLNSIEDRSADFYYSIVPEKEFLQNAADLQWSYMKVKDGKFASGNLVLIRPQSVLDKYDMIKFVSSNRKSFLLGVFRASPKIFFKLLLRRVTLHDAESLMTKMFGIDSRLVVFDDYRIGFDLDLPDHLDWLRSRH